MLIPDQIIGSLFVISILMTLWSCYIAERLRETGVALEQSRSQNKELRDEIRKNSKTHSGEINYLNSRVKELESCKTELLKQIAESLDINLDYCRRLSYIARAANTSMKFNDNDLSQQSDDDEEELDELDEDDEDEEFDVVTFAQKAVNQLDDVADTLREIIDNS